MGQRSLKGSPELARSIRMRRNELGFTIQEAALRAGVGTKTWSRYESGESVRKDKCKGICKALNWRVLPSEEHGQQPDVLDWSAMQTHEAWSQYFVNNYGKLAAASFAVGSDILLDYVKEDLAALSEMPQGTHIGQIGTSFLDALLPPQFLMKYDYDFLYMLLYTVTQLRAMAQSGIPIVAKSVIEELALYLMVEESRFLIESADQGMELTDVDQDGDWDTWIFDVFGDMDIVSCLFSDQYLTNNHAYHFDHWMDRQFYCKNG